MSSLKEINQELARKEAASDLYDACQSALSDLKWIERQKESNNFQSTILKLEAAIKKADGDS